MIVASPEQGHREARELTREHARSFHFASFLLTRERREAARAIYAFCRIADDAVDESCGLPVRERRRRLDEVRGRLDAIYAGRPDRSVDAALAEVVTRHGVPRAPFDDLLTGLEIDL